MARTEIHVNLTHTDEFRALLEDSIATADENARLRAEVERLRADAAIGKRLREVGQDVHWSAQGAINEALAAGGVQ